MQNGTASLENSVDSFLKRSIYTDHMTQPFHFYLVTQEKQKHVSTQALGHKCSEQLNLELPQTVNDLYWSTQAAVSKCHRLHDLNNRSSFSHNSGGQKVHSQDSSRVLVLLRALFLVCRWLLCPFL